MLAKLASAYFWPYSVCSRLSALVMSSSWCHSQLYSSPRGPYLWYAHERRASEYIPQAQMCNPLHRQLRSFQSLTCGSWKDKKCSISKRLRMSTFKRLLKGPSLSKTTFRNIYPSKERRNRVFVLGISRQRFLLCIYGLNKSLFGENACTWLDEDSQRRL